MALLWCGLASWQSYRGYARCGDAGPWGPAYWALCAIALAAPLLALLRIQREELRPRRRTFDVPLAVVLMTYVPLTLAMRLVEVCGTSR